MDHEGGGAVKFCSGGKKWNVITDWIASDQSIVRRWSRLRRAVRQERHRAAGLLEGEMIATSTYWGQQ